MDKKRLLAIFAAFVTAATMAIGFSACEDKDSGTIDGEKSEQSDDETIKSEAVTEEQWKAIWEEAKKFNHSGTIKGTQIMYDSLSIEADYKIEYSAEKNLYLEKLSRTMGQEEFMQDVLYEFKETEVNISEYEGSWYTIQAENYFAILHCGMPGILYVPLRKTEEGQDINFGDCYDIASYNETTKDYDIQTWIKIGSMNTSSLFAFVDIQIKIIDAQLSELTITIQNYKNDEINTQIPNMVINYKFDVEIDLSGYEYRIKN